MALEISVILEEFNLEQCQMMENISLKFEEHKEETRLRMEIMIVIKTTIMEDMVVTPQEP